MTSEREPPAVSPADWDALREILVESGPYLDLVERLASGASAKTLPPPGGLDRGLALFRTMRLLASTFGLPPVGNLAHVMERAVNDLRNGERTNDMCVSVRYAVTSARSLLRFVEARVRAKGPKKRSSRGASRARSGDR